MAMHVAAEYMACVDCYRFEGIGPEAVVEGTNGGEERLARCIAAREAMPDGGKHLVCGDSDKEEEFSWRPCEVCGCKLGGSRHHMVRLAEGPGTV